MATDSSSLLAQLAAATQSEVKTLKSENAALKHRNVTDMRQKEKLIAERDKRISKLETELRVARKAATTMSAENVRKLEAARAGIEHTLEKISPGETHPQRKRRRTDEVHEDVEQTQSARKRTRSTVTMEDELPSPSNSNLKLKDSSALRVPRSGILQPVVLTPVFQSYIAKNELSLDGRRVVKSFHLYDVFGLSSGAEFDFRDLPSTYQTPPVVAPATLTLLVSIGELTVHNVGQNTSIQVTGPGSFSLVAGQTFILLKAADAEQAEFTLSWDDAQISNDEAETPGAPITFIQHLETEAARIGKADVPGHPPVNRIEPNEVLFSKIFDFLLEKSFGSEPNPENYIFLCRGKVEDLIDSEIVDACSFKLFQANPTELPILTARYPQSIPSRDREVLVRGRMLYEVLSKAYGTLGVKSSDKKMRQQIHKDWLLEPITNPLVTKWLDKTNCKDSEKS